MNYNVGGYYFKLLVLGQKKFGLSRISIYNLWFTIYDCVVEFAGCAAASETGLKFGNVAMIEIRKGRFISEDDVIFKFSRSSGPGGQNVNKVNTRVTVFLDVAGRESFSESEKKRILKRLATRADKNGVVRVVSQKYRTQRANREAALKRLAELLKGALEVRPIRKKTKVPEAVKRRRLEQKKQRSMLKKQRMKITALNTNIE
jgi:ribosome-associated protein